MSMEKTARTLMFGELELIIDYKFEAVRNKGVWLVGIQEI